MSYQPPSSITGANLTLNLPFTMQTNVLIDWCSFNCKSPTPHIVTINPNLTIKMQNYSTQVFKFVYLIYSAGEEICTICTQPLSPILPADMVQCKLSNKVLYTNNCTDVIEVLCESFNMSFNGFSRIDLAVDFNPIQIGFNVHKFITDIMSKKVIKKQRASCTLGFNTSLNNSYHFIRFGEKQSDICFYLYDKTKEMNDKKLKPWIIDSWKQSGINVDSNVWRLEFSIKNTLYSLTNTVDGDTITLKDLQALKADNVANLFTLLYSKYFDFRNNNNTARVDRMPKITMLDVDTTVHILQPLTNELQSNRTQKLTIKQLLKEYHYLRTYKATVREELKVSAYQYAKSYQLTDYANKQDVIFASE